MHAMGRSREGVREKGEGVGRKKESPAVNPKHFTELHSPTNGEQMLHFDWLVACQSKKMTSEIRHSCIRTQQDQNTYGRVRGSSEFSVPETLKALSQNGKHIDLKPEQEAAIRV